MGFVGRHDAPTFDQAKVVEKGDFYRKTNLFFLTQNSLTHPRAKQYVSKLFQEAPQAKEAVDGKLAVVTGVTIGGIGYHMAEELALAANMSVILMGRNPKKLEAAEAAIQTEAKKRGVSEPPKLHHVEVDLNDLESILRASEETQKIAKESYSGKLSVLINNAGANITTYKLTKQNVEANIGINFLAPHLLTEKLIPLMKAAATESYKPRCIFVASAGYCLSLDLDPDLLVEKPRLGGAPEGFWKFDDEESCQNTVMELTLMYGRAKLGEVATAFYLSQLHPEINFTSQTPGSIVSNFTGNLGLVGYIYYYGFYIFQLSANQGALAALRAALDPAFDTEAALQGAYLHSDGNPWPLEPLKIDDPTTKKVYEWDTYSKKVFEAANKVIENVLKKK